MPEHITAPLPPAIAFIGGGNMATALVGGLLAQDHPACHIHIVEPSDVARAALLQRFGITAAATADVSLARAQLVVWAIKPQTFQQAAITAAAHTAQALHLSVAAGITTQSMARWLKSEHIARAMPNTPALIGQGITGLFARPQVTAESRALIEQVIASTGQTLWVEEEEQLDAVTALSGSGPAYVFLLLEAMIDAGSAMGLSRQQAHHLAVATFQGAAQLAAQSDEPPETLRQRVTSKGGTTHAAISHMQNSRIPEHFMEALHKARARAQEMAAEFGN